MATPKQFHWIMSVPVGVIISIFGLIGNAISIIIWKRILKKNFGRNKSTAIYLIALAMADSGLLIFFLLDDTLPKIFPSLLSSISYCYFHCYVGFPFFFYFIASSIWLVVCVTFNRFIMVNFPVKAKDFCSPSRAYLGISITLAFCFFVNIPHFLNFEPSNTDGNDTECFKPSKYGSSKGAVNYEFWVHCIFLVLAPWASIAFFNGGIIRALQKRAEQASKKFSKSRDSKEHDQQMTRMLLAVTFTFLVLLAWQCITQCFFMLGYNGRKGEKWDHVDKAFAFAKLGVIINSSVNFLLYNLSGSMFRKELLTIFGRSPSNKYLSGSSASGGTKITNESISASESQM
ncbi:G-protein coupled receptor daf-37-like [Rhopilema esculentum]|uniref:G-protein coupled receptor daf-37-like n=1 Tax=Rhopilema esculentum TaxID=499914 RepID=UPI0031D76BE9